MVASSAPIASPWSSSALMSRYCAAVRKLYCSFRARAPEATPPDIAANFADTSPEDCPVARARATAAAAVEPMARSDTLPLSASACRASLAAPIPVDVEAAIRPAMAS